MAPSIQDEEKLYILILRKAPLSQIIRVYDTMYKKSYLVPSHVPFSDIKNVFHVHDSLKLVEKYSIPEIIFEPIDKFSKHGGTLLHAAILTENVELVRHMIYVSIDELKGLKYSTTTSISVNLWRVFVNKSYAMYNPLLAAAAVKNTEIMNIVYEFDLYSNLYNNIGYTEPTFKQIGCLLPNTALHYAVLYRNYKACDFLLSKGFDINTVNDSMKTALFVAAEEGMTDMCHYLLDHGAETDSVDLRGLKCIDVADSEDLRIILRRGPVSKISSALPMTSGTVSAVSI